MSERSPPSDVTRRVYIKGRLDGRTFIILLAGVMSQIPVLLLYLAAASVSSYYLAPTRELKVTLLHLSHKNY